MAAGSPEFDSPPSAALEGGRLLAALFAAWLAIGWLWAWIGSRWSPVLLLPALAGAVTGISTGYLLHGPFTHRHRQTGQRQTGHWGWGAVAAGTLIVVAMQHLYPYVLYRQAIAQSLLAAQSDPQTAAKLELSGLDVRPQRFDVYLRAQTERGRPWLAGTWQHAGVWFTWGIDALVTLTCGFAAWRWYRRGASQPGSAGVFSLVGKD